MLRSIRMVVEVVVGVTVAVGHVAQAGNAGANELNQATRCLTTVAELAKEVADRSEMGFYKDGHAVFGCVIEPGQSLHFHTNLKSGERYLFFAVGDAQVRDIDLAVTDPDDDLAGDDTATDARPVVEFRAPMQGAYEVRLTNARGRGASVCFVAIMQRNGWTVPKQNVERALRGVAMSTLGETAIQAVNGRTMRLQRQGVWCFYGGVLRANHAATLSRVPLGPGRRSVLAAGDTHAEDVDLHVSNGTKSDVARDVDADATPIVRFSAEAGQTYGLRMSLPQADGPSFVLMVVFEVQESAEVDDDGPTA